MSYLFFFIKTYLLHKIVARPYILIYDVMYPRTSPILTCCLFSIAMTFQLAPSEYTPNLESNIVRVLLITEVEGEAFTNMN